MDSERVFIKIDIEYLKFIENLINRALWSKLEEKNSLIAIADLSLSYVINHEKAQKDFKEQLKEIEKWKKIIIRHDDLKKLLEEKGD